MRKALVILLAAGLLGLGVMYAKAMLPPEGELNPKWTACQADSECVLIHYGCGSSLSSNQAHKVEATDYAYKLGGDPRAIECVYPHGDEPQYTAQCVESHCQAVPVESEKPEVQ